MQFQSITARLTLMIAIGIFFFSALSLYHRWPVTNTLSQEKRLAIHHAIHNTDSVLYAMRTQVATDKPADHPVRDAIWRIINTISRATHMCEAVLKSQEISMQTQCKQAVRSQTEQSARKELESATRIGQQLIQLHYPQRATEQAVGQITATVRQAADSSRAINQGMMKVWQVFEELNLLATHFKTAYRRCL